MTSQQGYDTYDTPDEPIMNNKQYLTNSNASSNCSQNKIALVEHDESSYLMRMNNKFGVVPQTEKNNMQSIFTALIGLKNYAMFVCVLVEDDTKDSFNKLNVTLKSIYNGVEGLNKFGFTYENILVCCFIKRIETNTFMFNNKLIIDSLTSPDNRMLSYWKYVHENPNNVQVQVQVEVTEQENQLNNNNINNNNNNSSNTPHLSILFTTAPKYLTFTFPDAITFMHNQIIPSLTNQKIIYITTITNGISTSETTFPQLLCSLSKNIQNVNNNTNSTHNPNLISVASIEHAPNTVNQSIWDKISQYELIYYNNYDLNYYDLSGGVPVDHRCNIMQLDSNGRNIIKSIYKAIPSNASIEYCDYAVSIDAVCNHIEVQYCHNVNAYINDIGYISYVDYMRRFITKHGGDYACLLNLMNALFTNSKKQCKTLSKVICVLQLIGMIFEMIQPSLTCMVVYSVFAEGFNTFNMQPAVFLTSFLGMLFTLSGVIALITKQQRTSQIQSNMHFILFIVYEIYFMLIIIVAMCAMYFIKHKQPTISESDLNSNAAYENYNDYLNISRYDFNTAAVVSIILINIIIGVMPMLIQFKKFFAENIVNALLYLVFGSISANSHFLVSYLHKFGEYRGNSDHMKTVYVVVFYVMNYFVGYLTMINTCRQKRVNAVLILSIIFTCYNSLKCLAIVFKKIYIDKKVVDVITGNNAVETVKNVVNGVNDLCLDNTKEDKVAINNQSLEENNNVNDKDGIEGGEQVQAVENELKHANQSTHGMESWVVQDKEEINNNEEEIEENVIVKDITIKAVENESNSV